MEPLFRRPAVAGASLREPESPMRPMMTLTLVAALVGSLAAPAAGQSLRQRIDAVKQMRQDQAKKRSRERKVEILQALYYSNLTVAFHDTPARDAFDYIRTALGINMVVHYADDPSGAG